MLSSELRNIQTGLHPHDNICSIPSTAQGPDACLNRGSNAVEVERINLTTLNPAGAHNLYHDQIFQVLIYGPLHHVLCVLCSWRHPDGAPPARTVHAQTTRSICHHGDGAVDQHVAHVPGDGGLAMGLSELSRAAHKRTKAWPFLSYT